MQLLLYTGIFLFLGGRPVTGFTDQGKPRVIVLTDIENEPDDAQSLVRSLTYVNQFEVEGIIATTSIWLRNQTAEWRIHEILEAYREVQPNLEKHETGYPTYNELKGKTKAGIPLYGMNGVGEGKDSEGYVNQDVFTLNTPSISTRRSSRHTSDIRKRDDTLFSFDSHIFLTRGMSLLYFTYALRWEKRICETSNFNPSDSWFSFEKS